MSPPRSKFLEHFLRLNGLEAEEFAAWEFLPGMRFGEREAWWRGGAPRDVPHEGLDLAAYRNREGRRVAFPTGTRVPILWPGEVAAIVPDFLGASVFVAHARGDEQGRRLHTVYGHLSQRRGLAPGSILAEGDELGAIADTPARRPFVPAHLHLTVAWIADGTPGRLDWSALHDPARTLLLDPLPLL